MHSSVNNEKALRSLRSLRLCGESKVHFIGIGGTGMSGLAHYLSAGGSKVSGSDLQLIPSVEQYLRQSGIKIFHGHNAENVRPNTNLVVKSAAIPDTNPEIIQARKYRIPIVKYAELLGYLMGRAGYGIAVSGAHGKTTTSALMAYLLHQAGKKPSFVIGGVLKDFRSSAGYNKSKYFVAEACEYDRSFHKLPAIIRVVNNIEPDHLDYYGSFGNIIKAFRAFCRMAPKNGLVIANIDSPAVRKCIKGLKTPITTFGTSPKADWYFKSVITSGSKTTGHPQSSDAIVRLWTTASAIRNPQSHFRVWHKRKLYGNFRLGIPGHHNFYNALACIIAADALGINKTAIRKALAGFSGVERRFDVISDGADTRERVIINDYGHHPTELASTLRTARTVYPNRRIFCVFQPHQYSRTRRFLAEFAQTLQSANVVLVPPIYSARDSQEERKKISSIHLVDKINAISPRAKYFPDFEGIILYLKANTIPGDVIITMGAGDVWEVGQMLHNELSR